MRSFKTAGYEGDGKSFLVIKGKIINPGMRDAAPVGTQVASLCRYSNAEAKLIVKRRHQIDL